MGSIDVTQHQKYSQIKFNKEMYKPYDAIVVKNEKDIEIAMINNIFDFNDETLFEVRKFIFAKKLKRLFKECGEEYDETHEVVQDLSKCYTISVKKVIKKCVIALLCTEENTYTIRHSNMNITDFYSCRFSVKGSQLFPVLNNIAEKLHDTPSTTLNTQILNGIENTPVKNGHNAIETSFQNEFSPPAQRNSVKRDLNKSFGNSPTSGNKSILNYSIIQSSDDENKNDKKLVIKLQVSKRRNGSTNENIPSSPPKMRKSSRSISRKSYADYISPLKSSPSKRRFNRESDDDDIDTRENTVTRSSPRKQLRCANSTPSKREIKRPTRYDNNFDVMFKRTPRGTPVRRSLRLSSTDLEDSPKSVRNTRKSIIYEDEEKLKKGTNLDDSLRKNILKVIIEKEKRREIKKPFNLIDSFEISDDEEDSNKKKPNSDPLTKNMFKGSTKKVNRNGNKKVNLIDTDDESDNEEVSNKNRVNIDDLTSDMRIHLKNLNLSSENLEEDSDVSCKEMLESDTLGVDKGSPRKKTVTKTQKRSTYTPKSNKKTYTPTKTKTPLQIPKGTPKSTKVGTPKTPKNRAKLIREGVVIPSMQERSKKIKGDSTPLMKARSQLHVSYVPESLPCREKEYCDIFNFVEGKLLDGCGGCMYISGVPGTGKTATVTSVISNLQENKTIPKFTFVNINGMRLSEPRQSYVEILKQLCGKSLSWEQSQNTLEEMFIKQKKMTPIVMLIDELDILCTKRQDVVYNLLDWPTKAKNQLIVITIANTMDLPERLLMNRVTSRLGLTRLTFQAYTYKQLQEIVMKRLWGTDSFNPDAVQFVARKVASVSGDARRALDICRRAAEIAETEGKAQLVNMGHVNEALSAMITQPKVLAIKSCSRLEQFILQSTVAEVERTGVEETTFCDVYKMLKTCAGIDGFKMVSSTLAQSAVSRLSACRLILADQKCNNIYQKIILNVSIDDVYYALKRN